MENSPIERPPTLTEATTRRLEAGIKNGSYGQVMPGEINLAEDLGVARVTVRRALKQLENEGLISATRPGSSRKVLGPSRNREKSGGGKIGILLRSEARTLDLHTQEVLEDITGALKETGFQTSTHSPSVGLLQRPGHRLSRLIDTYPADAWILMAPSIPVASWFARQKIPTVACGGPALGCGLPIVAHDGVATIRHAYLHLIRKGHRRITIMMPFERPGRVDVIRAVYQENGLPFSEANQICVYQNDPKMLLDQITARLTGQESPTALVLSDISSVLALYSICLRYGIRIPGDISYILIYDSPLSEAISPPPCRYRTFPKPLARAVIKTARQLLEHPGIPPEDYYLLMEYVEGGSVAEIAPAGIGNRRK